MDEMIIKIIREPSINETEVNILCKEKNVEVASLYNYIKQFSEELVCYQEKQQVMLPIYEILYMESIDGKTFVYTKNTVFQHKETLKSMEHCLVNKHFARISKSVIINVKQLKHVEPYENHRLLATMNNGEQLVIARTYIHELKNKIVQR
jgi:DNA-binding LytR/AlgR family response regulator